MRWALAGLAVVAATAGLHAQSGDSTWFDLPARGGEHALATTGGVRADRAHVLALAARMRSSDESGTPMPSPLDETTEDRALAIPAPLNEDAWRHLLELKRGDDLLPRLLANRAATLLAAGFTSTDSSVRQLALRDRSFLERIYLNAPGAFAAFARSLRIEGGRVVVPGGGRADVVWEALADASPANPQKFITALLTKDGGRLAWYFDTLATLDPARLQQHALPEGAGRDRVERARALYESFQRVELRWRVEEQPYRRSAGDPWMVLNMVELRDGVVAGPPRTGFWEALFAGELIDRASARRIAGRRSPDVSLIWLARTLASVTVRERKERFDMFRLAQRVFPIPRETDAQDLLVALGGYRRYKAILLTLERLQIASAPTWAALVEAARRVDRSDGDRATALAAFQGAFALVSRMWHVGTLDSPAAERLLRALADAVRTDGRVHEQVARWMTATLIPSLQPQSVVAALAGPAVDTARTIKWEDLDYRIDFAAAERARLERILSIINAPPLDAALASRNPSAMAAALLSLNYAVALGDPEGAVMLGRDIVARHDFGLDSLTEPDAATPWALPLEIQLEGMPWHVRGSIVGLELGLARLSLRHLSDGEMPSAPTLTTNDYGTLAQTVVSMRPEEFLDVDRDEIVAAIARGRQRVADAGHDLQRLGALAREADLSSSTRSLLPWIAAHEPETLPSLFSVRDLLWLGRPALPADRLNRWGMHARAFDGRLTREMPRARAWDHFTGRTDTGMMTTQVPDVTLRLAEETARLRLPAALIPALLSYAIQDFWYEVRARFADDWPAMARQPAGLRPERVEDYVAALAGTGVLRLGEAPR